jgi:hypothetical protein
MLALIAALLLAGSPALGTTIIVDKDGGGDYLTIQEGIDAAAHGDTVLVLPGPYFGLGNIDLDCSGKAITVTAQPARDPVLIACGYVSRGFVFQSGETPATVVRGFHIIQGDAGYGGGINCSNSSPTIQDCMIQGCTADAGGGMNVDGMSSPQILDCDFLGNWVKGGGGGGLRCSGSFSRPSIKGCRFEGNTAYYGGGIMSRDGACPSVENSVFEWNSAEFSGGMRFEAGSATVTSCVFLANVGVSGGAMGSGYYSTPTLRFVTCIENIASMRGACFANGTYADVRYCTFVGGASPNGGGMFCGEPFGTMELRNSIVAFSSQGAAVTCDAIGWPTITHCCVFGNVGGDVMCGNTFSNIFEDPTFCDLGGRDLTLSEDSPCLPSNNAWGELIGAHEQGCEGPTPVDDISWGAIKAMYR